jgi:hypothetical protein
VTDASSEFRSSTTFGGNVQQRCYPAFVPAASHSYSPHLRRSLPTLNHSMAVAMSANSAEPPKLYPYHLLLITNYRLPGDVDRLNLEVRFGLFVLCIFYPLIKASVLRAFARKGIVKN